VKIKVYRGEPLNEKEDDLADEGKTLTKTGDIYQWTDRMTRLVYLYYDRADHQCKKVTWSKTIRNAERRGVTEFLMEERLKRGSDKWRTELFKPRLELWEGEKIEPVGSTEKWETVASVQWIQKEVWNRKGRKAMGDWLHDKLIPWKTRRRLLQTLETRNISV